MSAGSGKRTRLEMEAIYADVEDHLVRLPEGRVKAQLIGKYKVHPSTVGKWIREVYARFKASSKPDEIREDRRNLMRLRLETIQSMAVNKSVVLRTPDGKPVMDPKDATKPMRIAAPDLKNALDACKQLRDLDGLDAPIKVESTTNSTTTTTFVLGAEDRKALENGLKGLA